MSRGRPREAERALRRALAVLDTAGPTPALALLRARVLITLAHAEFDLLGLDAASARLDEARRLAGAHELAGVAVALHNQRGIFLLRVGQLAQALAEFDAGAADRDPAAAEDRCKVLLNRAVAHIELRSVAAARLDLVQCLREADLARLPLVRLKATHNLGFVEFLAGNLPRALQLMDEAYALDPSVAPGIALLGKAEVLVEAGLIHEADDVLCAAARILRRERLTHDLAECELERARCALAVDDPVAARRLAAQSRDRYRRRGDARRRSAELIVVQADVAAGRHGASVQLAAQRLGADLADAGLRLLSREARLVAAEAHLAAGRIGPAAQILDDLGPPRRDDPITGRLHSHYAQASVDAARGSRSAASRRVRSALAELAGYQASFGSIDLRTASAVHGRRLAELDLTLALASGRAAAVFAAAERGRAVSERLPPLRSPEDPVSAELLAELRQAVESLRAAAQDPVAVEAVLRRRRRLEREIVARTWGVTGAGRPPRPATLDQVRADLGVLGATMVMYLHIGGALSAVVVRGAGRVHVENLGPAAPVLEWLRRARADLDVLAQPRLPGPLRSAVRASLRRSVAELGASLVTPLRLDGPLVMVSTGSLGQVPWAALPPLAGVSVVVAPSASRWLGCTRPGLAVAPTVTAIAGPDLDRAADEAQTVAAAWPGSSAVVGRGATGAALLAALAHAPVLHVAAHGTHQSDNPLFSSIRMVDGPVFAHEFERAARTPHHVVLSACEAGLASVRPGDEALGLASVLVRLGTSSVVAGVSRVGDDLAAAAMTAYHARLLGGSDSATALAGALVDVAGDDDVAAPFICFGAAWSIRSAETAPVAQPADLAAADRVA
jgi:hypothetical protein